ncbi:hypothetical protein IU476_06425 [Nocardia blacklockiae]|nr:hypothetical protein [Nocardia blacklockiae]
MLSERRAKALAALAANEEDLAVFIRHGEAIAGAADARDGAITGAVQAHDRAVGKALSSYRAAAARTVHTIVSDRPMRGNESGSVRRRSAALADLVAALDAAHLSFVTAIGDAVGNAESAVVQGLIDQGSALKRVRERGGLKTGELAELVELTPADVAKLIRIADDAAKVSDCGESLASDPAGATHNDAGPADPLGPPAPGDSPTKGELLAAADDRGPGSTVDTSTDRT